LWHYSVVKFQSLQDLKLVQKKIAEAQAKAAAVEAARLEALRKAEAEKTLFIRAIGKVKALPTPNKAPSTQTPRPPVATQRQKDEAQVIQDSLSDDFDVSTLLDTDDALSFRRPSVGTDVTRKLRKANGPFKERSICMACAVTRLAKRSPVLSATPTNTAFGVFGWCMARAWGHPAKRQC
jgi:hypothetical protein